MKKELDLQDITENTDKPRCELIGKDGNVFNVIGRVKSALRKAGQGEKSELYVKQAFRLHTYDEVLQLSMKYVEVY